MPITAVVIYLLVAVIYVIASIKRVGKEERLVYFKAGKPTTLVGPGVVLALPGFQRTRRLKVSPNTTTFPEIRFKGAGRPLLVTGSYTWKIIDPLKAANLPNVNARIEQQLESTFGDTLLNATLKDCLCDNFTLENVAEDLLNEQTRLFGVKISKLECKNFPAHRELAAQIAALVTAPISQLEALTEKIAERPNLPCD